MDLNLAQALWFHCVTTFPSYDLTTAICSSLNTRWHDWDHLAVPCLIVFEPIVAYQVRETRHGLNLDAKHFLCTVIPGVGLCSNIFAKLSSFIHVADKIAWSPLSHVAINFDSAPEARTHGILRRGHGILANHFGSTSGNIGPTAASRNFGSVGATKHAVVCVNVDSTHAAFIANGSINLVRFKAHVLRHFTRFNASCGLVINVEPSHWMITTVIFDPTLRDFKRDCIVGRRSAHDLNARSVWKFSRRIVLHQFDHGFLA